MFARIAVHLITISALAVCTAASPLAAKSASALAARTANVSLSGWGGFSSLDNFDNFYGVGNFNHSVFDQIIVQNQQVVCQTQAVEIIQQRLVVLQEMAKKIVTEQICEVETQTIVFSQFQASLGLFTDDLRRRSVHQVGFDEVIVSRFTEIIQSDGSLSTNDLGFSGSDVGTNTIVPTGNNWNDASSPVSVDSALSAAHNAGLGL
ncbi:hypothetical protein L218DRAFT_118199 [Marasmius fiardii PR-910]|nr:hypothetical protein L218DRAFT_118199 [Marasmius fiardii PR-910]